MKPLFSTKELGLNPTKQGKVRDIFDFGDKLLIVATDRISVFDVVLPDPIPYKGIVLTQITKFWLEYLDDVIENHIIQFGISGLPQEFVNHRNVLEKRSMVVKKATVLPIECIVRGYISGSGWKEYKSKGTVCGIKITNEENGGKEVQLKESDKLPYPIFTPSTKADVGHDENISFDEVIKILGNEKSEFIKQKSLQLYQKAAEFALTKGIIIADTKFEFGTIKDSSSTEKIILIDEVLTPDSSRFWPKEKYEPGKPQPSFDKQFVRDYTESTGWNKTYPGPHLPKEVVETTTKNYLKIYSLLTGKDLDL
jgi:phosphoribosylaminoimidazole-succinocarboxamide synthase